LVHAIPSESPITLDEVINVQSYQKSRKSPGTCGIQKEILNIPEIQDLLLLICNNILGEAVLSEEW
jgi:hypothetical protein